MVPENSVTIILYSKPVGEYQIQTAKCCEYRLEKVALKMWLKMLANWVRFDLWYLQLSVRKDLLFLWDPTSTGLPIDLQSKNKTDITIGKPFPSIIWDLWSIKYFVINPIFLIVSQWLFDGGNFFWDKILSISEKWAIKIKFSTNFMLRIFSAAFCCRKKYDIKTESLL